MSFYDELKKILLEVESIPVMIAWDLHEHNVTTDEFQKHDDEELKNVIDPLKNQIYNALRDIEIGFDKTPPTIRLKNKLN